MLTVSRGSGFLLEESSRHAFQRPEWGRQLPADTAAWGELRGWPVRLLWPGFGCPWEEAQKLTLPCFGQKLIVVSTGVGL